MMNGYCYAALCVHLCSHAACMHVCMFASVHSPFPAILSPAVVTVALLSPLFRRHTCSHSHYSSMMQPPPLLYWLMLWSRSSRLIFLYPGWNIMLTSHWSPAVFWGTKGGPGGTGGPLSHSLSPGADGSGWARQSERAPFVPGCSIVA